MDVIATGSSRSGLRLNCLLIVHQKLTRVFVASEGGTDDSVVGGSLTMFTWGLPSAYVFFVVFFC